MGDIKPLIFEIDWKTFLWTLLIVVVGFLAIRKIVLELYNAIGVVPPWKRERDEMNKKISKLDEEMHRIEDEQLKDREKLDSFYGKFTETQSEILGIIKELKTDVVNGNIEQMRFSILNFANEIRNRDYSKEAYDHIIETYDKYEQILRENGLENGRVDAAIAYIRQKYEEYLKTGFPY